MAGLIDGYNNIMMKTRYSQDTEVRLVHNIILYDIIIIIIIILVFFHNNLATVPLLQL
jgi:uncharacterized integral membrane protein